MTLYSIYCSTGCTCCCVEDHSRGFYKTEEDAQTRMNYWLNAPPEIKPPVASQYAPNGRYKIRAHDVEVLSDGRLIIDDTFVYTQQQIMTVADGGIIEHDPSVTERLDNI